MLFLFRVILKCTDLQPLSTPTDLLLLESPGDLKYVFFYKQNPCDFEMFC